YTADFDELAPFLEKALDSEWSEDDQDRGIVAAGIARAGKLLAQKYVWQITNVPYLSSGKQDNALKEFCEHNYPKSKGDIATVFFEKMLKSNNKGEASCVVIPQNWLFLTPYKQLRKYFLEKYEWNI